MAPPVYADIGKSCRDIFSKGYHFGFFKLDLKSSTVNGVDITSGGIYTFEEGKVFGNLETKYKVPQYGLTFTEKWNTSNVLATEISCEDKLAPGVKVALETLFNPDNGKKSGKVKAQYKTCNATVEKSLDMGDDAPLAANGSIVLAYQGWLGGYQMAYDTQEGKITKNNFAIGYNCGDFQLHTSVDNGEVFNGSLYHRVSSRLETGIQLAWTAGKENSASFAMGTKYLMDSQTALRAKVNNKSQLGFGFEQKIRDGVTLTLSTFIDGKNFKAGGHKVGIALELEP